MEMKNKRISKILFCGILVTSMIFNFNVSYATVGLSGLIDNEDNSNENYEDGDYDTSTTIDDIPTLDDDTYSSESISTPLDESTELNRENIDFYETLQQSWEENPNGSSYSDDYAYYKVGGLTEQPGVHAPSAILMDADSNFVLYNKGATERKYPASMTKVMTALVALEYGNLSDVITFSENAVNEIPSDATKAGFAVGDQATLEEVLYGLFMASGADCAVAIAEQYGGSVEGFVKMMNEKAQQLGCANTNFVNPHGLHDANHYTTAYDMALIMQDAIEYESFRNIIGTKSYTVKDSDTTKVANEIKLQNRSALLSEGNDNYFEFAKGSKTGHTDAAKYTLVSYASKSNETLICVVMEEESFDNSYADTKRLYEWAYRKTQVVTPMPSSDEIGDILRLSMTDDKFEKIKFLNLKYLSGYGILTNTAINKDAIKTFFILDEDMESGILGFLNTTYYDKILIGRTPILYETEGEGYDNYYKLYHPDETDSIIIETSDGNGNTQYTLDEDGNISDDEMYDIGGDIEEIDRFDESEELGDLTVFGQVIKYYTIYGALMIFIAIIVYIVILVKKKKEM